MLRRSIFGTAKDTKNRALKQASARLYRIERISRKRPVMSRFGHRRTPCSQGCDYRSQERLPRCREPPLGHKTAPENVLPRKRKRLPNRHPKTPSRKRNRPFRECDHRPRNRRLPETKSPLPDFRQGRFSKIRLPAPFPAPAESERIRLCPGLSKRSCPARSSREPACRETNGPNTPATWKPHRRSSGHWPGEAPASRRSRYPSWSSRRP